MNSNLTFDGSTLTLTGLLQASQKTPLCNDPCTTGQICWDSNYIYVCVGTNFWNRVALNDYCTTPTPTPSITPTNTPTQTPTSTPTPTPTPTNTVVMKALLFMESGDDSKFMNTAATDIGTYMNTNGSGAWYGFAASGLAGINANDILTWMDWPGFVNGTTNVTPVIQQIVPQADGGNDAHGNPITSYLIETTEVPQNTVKGYVYFSFLVPISLTNNNTYKSFGINFNDAANALETTSVDSGVSSIDIYYTGSNWPNGHYRMYTESYGNGWSGGVSGTGNPFNYFFRANGF